PSPSPATHFEVSQSVAATSRRELAQHVVKDAPVAVVVELIERIDATQQRYALHRTIRRNDLGGKLLPRLETALQSADRDRLIAVQAERRPGGALRKGERQHAHADQVGAMDTLEALADHRPHAEQP